jgi:hypothetical protein
MQDVEKKRKAKRGAPQQQTAGPQRVPGALNELQLQRVDELLDSSKWVINFLC